MTTRGNTLHFMIGVTCMATNQKRPTHGRATAASHPGYRVVPEGAPAWLVQPPAVGRNIHVAAGITFRLQALDVNRQPIPDTFVEVSTTRKTIVASVLDGKRYQQPQYQTVAPKDAPVTVLVSDVLVGGVLHQLRWLTTHIVLKPY
jgi:hypothetical protein